MRAWTPKPLSQLLPDPLLLRIRQAARSAQHLTLLFGPDQTRMGALDPVRGFKSRKTAHNAIRGFEVMRMFCKGQFRSMVDSLAGGSEAQYIGRLF